MNCDVVGKRLCDGYRETFHSVPWGAVCRPVTLHRWATCLVGITICFAAAGTLIAQVQGADPTRTWDPYSISAFANVYYSYSRNHPDSAVNQGRNFDSAADKLMLDMAGVSVSRAAAPIGFRIDAGFGDGYKTLHAADASDDFSRRFPAFYLSWKPLRRNSLQFDFGKFYATVGAEGTEAHNRHNYSAALLYSYLTPNYHFGIRATIPLTAHWSGSIYAVNGWNTVRDNNGGKSVGGGITLTKGSLVWASNVLTGPELPGRVDVRRTLYDSFLQWAVAKRIVSLLAFDEIRDTGAGPAAVANGLSASATVTLTSRLSISPRIGWLFDGNGLATNLEHQRLRETTITIGYKLGKYFNVRGEYRRDDATIPCFQRGAQTGLVRAQPTFLVALLAAYSHEGK